MKKFLTAILLLTFFVSSSLFAVGNDQIKQVDRSFSKDAPAFLGYKTDELIVVMKDDLPSINLTKSSKGNMALGIPTLDVISERFAVSNFERQFKGSENSTKRGASQLSRYYKVKINDGKLDDAMAAYEADPMVDHVEKIGMHLMYATPNDGYFDPYQWYHNQANDDDLDSPEAWDIQTGNSSIILAILDSGTRYYHRDLGGGSTNPGNPGAARGNMWINDAELNGSNGVDDDGNGYTDDWIGYDFISSTSNCWPGEDCNTQDNDPRDFNGHGTHTAGIVGMITNNGYGMAGVAGGWGNGSEQQYGNGVKVMACRMGFSYNHPIYGEVGVVYMDAAAEAFYYAADNGATIASCSWGSSNSGGIAAAATYFVNAGGLIFVASGNDGSQNAGYLNSRNDCISVSATDQNDGAASFTTYGTWVDISAPGVGIYSTLHDHTDPNTDYWASMDGTSMACPMAAGVAAMIWSQNPSWTASQVENQLYSSADNIDAELGGQYIGKMGAGRVNLYNAVNTGPPPAPVANFSGSPTSGTEPLNVNFTDLSTGSITDWYWTFGDGGTSTSQSPSHTYTSAGTYNVSLEVNGPGGNDTNTKNGYITVDPCVAPTAGFTGSPTSGDYPLNVSFSNSSSGATSYSWDFGDSENSTAANPSHTYNSAGTFTVTLTATNSCGSDQQVRTNYITVTTPPCDPPVADFNGSPTSGDYPLNVSFTDASTNSPTSWSWTFGEGGTSTSQNPSYIYTAAGTYTVTMTATNSCGSDGVTKVDYVTVTEPSPVGSVYALSDIVIAGTVSGNYTNTQSSDNSYESITERESGGKPANRNSYLEHKWNFNVPSSSALTFYVEGYRPNNAEGDNFTFAYSTDNNNFTNLVTVNSATEQVYSASIPSSVFGTVYIRVVDTDQSTGAKNLDAVYIDEMYIEYSSVPVAPVADFSGSPTSGSSPLNVSFTDLSSGNPTSWSWTFGDGGNSTAQNPSYTYNSIGTYSVSLTATNANGSDGVTKTDYITVSATASDMHVNANTVTRAVNKKKGRGAATIVIFDSNSQPVANATVFVNFDGPNAGSLSGLTATDGSVSFNTPWKTNPGGEWCFEVTNVTHASLAYNSGDNVVTRSCESGPAFKNEGLNSLMPEAYALQQNYPNPFNPATGISFSLPQSGHVSLTIYNVAGQQVEVLVNGVMNAGYHTVEWDGSSYSSGVYLYRLNTTNFADTKKMVLIK